MNCPNIKPIINNCCATETVSREYEIFKYLIGSFWMKYVVSINLVQPQAISLENGFSKVIREIPCILEIHLDNRFLYRKEDYESLKSSIRFQLALSTNDYISEMEVEEIKKWRIKIIDGFAEYE